MKTAFSLGLLFLAIVASAESVKLWDGKERGMDLVAIGHKRVTVYLADGRTSVVGVPILVERTNAAIPVIPAVTLTNHVDHAAQKR